MIERFHIYGPGENRNEKDVICDICKNNVIIYKYYAVSDFQTLKFAFLCGLDCVEIWTYKQGFNNE